MKRILCLDTETTGLFAGTDACIEVACTLYDVAAASPIASFSSLIRAQSNAAESVNGISVEMLRKAPAPIPVWNVVHWLAAQADVVVAHRAEFDRGFVPSLVRDAKPWACSKFDIEWPRGHIGDHLVHLALAHGVPVYSAHRAAADVDTLVRLFQAAHRLTDVPAMLAKAMRPKVKVVALVSYDDREQAKAAGFAWDGASKTWSRRMAAEDVGALPFKTREVTT
jgi:DNA polymerase-3 subunit epsilon